MEKPTVRIALIGHRFMGKLHSHAYNMVQQLMDPPCRIELAVLCGRDEAALKAAQNAWGWREGSTDWRSVVARTDIDAVDIAVPGNAHAEIALAALAHGKHVLCEKPLANTLGDAQAMADAAQASGKVHMVGFNYRRAPAVVLARRLIDEGMLGKLFQVRGTYLQDWAVDPQVPLTWRFDRAIAGSGSLGDLLTHVLDMTRYLVGEFEQVTALSHTFVSQRPLPANFSGAGLGHAGQAAADAFGPVDVDDVTAVLAKLQDGVVGVFEATRFATGFKNALCLEVHGDRGAIRFDLERMNELDYYAVETATPARQGFRRILATHPDHPYMQYWWPEGHIVGYDVTFAHEIYDWLNAIIGSERVVPDFTDGLRCQAVVDAIAASARDGVTVRL